MRFANFELQSPIQTITLIGLAHEWDVHNFADLVRAEVSPDHGSAVVEWRVATEVANPWGSPRNLNAGCRLVFSGIRSFRSQGVSLQSDLPDSHTVRGISKTIPGEEAYPFKRDWNPGDDFCLRIETESSGVIDVDAELATLEAIPRLDV